MSRETLTKRQARISDDASDWRARYDRFGPAVCPDCWGFGWMRVDAKPGYPGFGKLVKCEGDHADPHHINLHREDDDAVRGA